MADLVASVKGFVISLLPGELGLFVEAHLAYSVIAVLAALYLSATIATALSAEAAPSVPRSTYPPFVPTKQLSVKDTVFLTFLQETDKKDNGLPMFVVTDPDLPDNPIVFASEGFCLNTGYQKSEVENRNCRFLQGPGTDARDTQVIRSAIASRSECSVQTLNYKKDGSTFLNQFFLMPMRDKDGKLAYFIGVQKDVDPEKQGKNVQGENAGWRLAKWLG